MLIIGHRGAAAVAPENTIVSLQRAFADGADGVEFDVQLSSDGAPVIFHDYTLKRTTGGAGRVTDTALADLRSLDAGSWFNRRFPTLARPEYADAGVPTLEEVFAACPRGLLYVELKCEPNEGRELARVTANIIREHGLQERVIVESFAHDAIAAVKHFAPDIRTAALFDVSWKNLTAPAEKIVAAAQAVNADEIAPYTLLTTKRLTQYALRHHLPTVIWTADAPAWAARARRYGVHAIITNSPAKMRAACARLSPAEKV
jgi:glycerophosphoryl diester phosphodiesterase